MSDSEEFVIRWVGGGYRVQTEEGGVENKLMGTSLGVFPAASAILTGAATLSGILERCKAVWGGGTSCAAQPMAQLEWGRVGGRGCEESVVPSCPLLCRRFELIPPH